MNSKLLAVAVSQIGVSEVPRGSNWGPKVEGYLATVNIKFPAPWCAGFVVWCHDQVGVKTIPRTAGVLNMWNKAKGNYAVKLPQPGDVFIMDFGKGKGHTGIVESVSGSTLTTIEGNTNDDGSREGYEVARRTRPVSAIKGFLRFC